MSASTSGVKLCAQGQRSGLFPRQGSSGLTPKRQDEFPHWKIRKYWRLRKSLGPQSFSPAATLSLEKTDFLSYLEKSGLSLEKSSRALFGTDLLRKQNFPYAFSNQTW